MAWRFVAAQVLTGQIFELDLPIAVDELRWELSGPGGFRGTILPEYEQLKWADGRPLFEEWGTYLYAEQGGIIRWGGILQKSSYRGAAYSLEAAGFTSYPYGINYTGNYYKRVNYDPTLIFEHIWAHVQAQPDGNTGVTVVRPTNCPVKVGTTAEPYELSWWEAPDCGQELGQLAQETPFDFTESHTWAGPTSDTVNHKVEIHYPRAGRRRDDLVFTPDNLRTVVEVDRDPATYANIVYAFGKGEGAATLRGESAQRDGRLRRPAVYTDKLASTKARCDALAAKERRYRALTLEVSSVTVNDHPNAPIGSWALGDDILVQATLPHVGEIALWSRIVGWSLLSESTAQLQLARADGFRYGTV